nr:type I-E CRISPR-associated protein Cse2/CasB [Siccibacter turicensis]
MINIQEDQRSALSAWHSDLNTQQGRRLRASLRRSHTLNEVYLSEGFRSLLLRTHTLWKRENQAWRFTALAIVAALAAHVSETSTATPFAAQLAQEKGHRQVMSVLRFQRLLAVRSHEELLRQLRRAVQLLGGNVNLLDLAESVFCWCREEDERIRHLPTSRQPTEYLRVRWTMQYYQACDSADTTPPAATVADTQE